MPQKFVSCIMPAKNAEKYIYSALSSLASQSHEKFEVIVVDDSSDDKTSEIASFFSSQDSRFSVVKNTGSGESEARNFGISLCKGEIVICCDADDINFPHRLQAQVSVFDNDRIVACGGGMQVISGDGRMIRAQKYSTSPRSNFNVFPIQSPHIPHPTLAIRRNAFVSSGGYRKFFSFAPDLDLLFRLEEQGELFNLQEEIVFYRLHETNLSKTVGFEAGRYASLAMASAFLRRSLNVDPIERGLTELENFNLTEETYRLFKMQEIVSYLNTKNRQNVRWLEADEELFHQLKKFLNERSPTWIDILIENRA